MQLEEGYTRIEQTKERQEGPSITSQGSHHHNPWKKKNTSKTLPPLKKDSTFEAPCEASTFYIIIQGSKKKRCNHHLRHQSDLPHIEAKIIAQISLKKIIKEATSSRRHQLEDIIIKEHLHLTSKYIYIYV